MPINFNTLTGRFYTSNPEPVPTSPVDILIAKYDTARREAARGREYRHGFRNTDYAEAQTRENCAIEILADLKDLKAKDDTFNEGLAEMATRSVKAQARVTELEEFMVELSEMCKNPIRLTERRHLLQRLAALQNK